MSTATWPVLVALEEALTDDATLMGLLAGEGVYARVAAGALPYVVMGSSTEQDGAPAGAGAFGREGNEGTETLHCWGRTIAEAKAIYAEVHRILHNQPLTLTGPEMLTGAVSYLTDQPDTESEAWQVVARYRWLARESA